VTVVPPPPPLISAASAIPSPAFTGQVVNFTATLGPGSGPVDSWLWEFGDATTSTLQNPPKTYTVANTYTVRVTAIGPVTTDFFQFSLTVNIPPPLLTTPSFTPIVPLVGGLPGENTVSFSVGPAAGSGPITSYLWTFHDLTTSTLQFPTFTYIATGAFLVTVSATGPGGTDGPIPITVNVYTPITSNFSISQPGPPGQNPPSEVFFTDTSTGAPAVSWAWNFGDGSPISTVRNPSHVYATPNVYNITLRVTDAMGRFDVRSTAFNVQ
jgi:PKD repeat protein